MKAIPRWTKSEVIVAVVISIIGILVAIAVAGINAYLILIIGMTILPGLLVVFVFSAVLRLLKEIGVDIMGPRAVVGLQVACGASASGAMAIILLLPAYYIHEIEPSWWGLVILPLAGIVIGAGVAGLLFLLRFDREERGELFPEARAYGRLAQALFTGKQRVAGVLVGGVAAMFHRSITSFFGFARGSVGFQAFGSRGPWLGIYPDVISLGMGYLAGPRIAITLLVSVILGQWILSPVLLSFFPDSVSIMGAGTGHFGAVFQVSRLLGIGLLAGAIPGYLLWGLIRLLSRKKQEKTETSFSRGYAVAVVVCLCVGLLLTGLGMALSGVSMAMVLAGSLLTLILAVLGSFALVRATATLGIDFTPLTALPMVTVLSLAFMPLLLEPFRGQFLFLMIGQVVIIAAFLAVVQAQTSRTGEMLGYPRTAVAIQVPVMALVSVGEAILVLLILHKSYGVGTEYLPVPQAGLLASFSREVMATSFKGWPLVAIGFLVGLILSVARLPALAAVLALYIPASYIIPASIGGLLRLVRPRRDDGAGGATASGLLAGVILVNCAIALLYALRKSPPYIGEKIVGELSSTGWLGMPTFVLIAVLLCGAGIMARRRERENIE